MVLIPVNENVDLKAIDEAIGDRFEQLNKFDLSLFPLSCEEEYLQHLAFMFDVDIGSISTVEAREILSKAITLKKFVGSVYYLEQMLSSLDGDVKVKEWFNYGGEPYHFKLGLHEIGISPTHFIRLKEMALTYKNVRSVFEGLEIELQPKATQITTTSATAFKLEFKSERQIGLIENKRVLARAVLTL